MIVKKGFIPPNLDLETPKPSLKLDERKIKVRTTHSLSKDFRTDFSMFRFLFSLLLCPSQSNLARAEFL
jgi:hypothetical protein